jgi:hypothetical protein
MEKKIHIMSLPTQQADVWEEITKEFEFFFSRNGNTIACRALQSDLEACWEMLKDKLSFLSSIHPLSKLPEQNYTH